MSAPRFHVFQVLVEEPSDDELERADSAADLESAELCDESAGMMRQAISMGGKFAKHPQTTTKLGLAVVGLLALMLGAAALASRSSAPGPVEAKVEVVEGKSLLAVAAYDAAEKSLQAVGSAGTNIESMADFVQTTNFSDILLNVNNTLKYLGLKGIQLKRLNSLRDGNPCPDDEEVFEGLCYQRCNTLTGGAYPIRTTAFSCCMREPCSFFNSKFSNPMKFCQGFDVGGHDTYGCPHSPGDCLVNEEFHMGFCYKQCAVLTNAAFPYRSSATTCCKNNAYVGCLEAEDILVNASFSVGGGIGDELLEAEMGMVHPPVPALAEEMEMEEEAATSVTS